MNQRFRIQLTLALLFLLFLSRAQNTLISGVINIYTQVNTISAQTLQVSNSAGFTAGSEVLIMQMKGVSVNPSNSINYGTITSYNDAGNYEFALVASVSGNNIVLNAPLSRTYNTQFPVQLVYVPVYANATVSSTLTCPVWNGYTGGVLALIVCGNLTLNNSISATAKGFRGSAAFTGSQSCVGDSSNYVLSSPNLMSSLKGEGVFVTNSSNEMSRGKNANGGGGANNVNGGGAGGGNFGAGGRGGDFQSVYTCPPSYQLYCGGVGGQALAYSNTANKVFMGGAGGTGHDNNGTSTPGGNGGGIIIIKAGNIIGNNQSIRSDGDSVTFLNSIDGQGGGGAGGSILLDVPSVSFLNVSAKGGFGGSDNYSGWDCHGKGGGGGGGLVWTSMNLPGLNTQLTGGNPGTFLSSSSPCYATSLGATQGGNGGLLGGLSLPGQIRKCEFVGLEEFGSSHGALMISPNPVNVTLNLVIQGCDIGEVAELSILNILGEKLYTENFLIRAFSIQKELHLETLSEGTYFLRLKAGQSLSNTRFIIRH